VVTQKRHLQETNRKTPSKAKTQELKISLPGYVRHENTIIDSFGYAET
jgi:hypothetical protein